MKRKPQYHVVLRFASDWQRHHMRGSYGSRVAARHAARALQLSIARGGVVMVLESEQLRCVVRTGFVAYL